MRAKWVSMLSVAVTSCTLGEYSFNGRTPDAIAMDSAMDGAMDDSATAAPDTRAIDAAPLEDRATADVVTPPMDGTDRVDAVVVAPDVIVAMDAGPPCNAMESPPANALYVDSAASAAGADGTVANPFATIAPAIARAELLGGRPIYLAPGMYPGTLTIANTTTRLSISGGFTPNSLGGPWRRGCGRLRTDWTLGGEVATGVIVANNAQPVTFEALAVRTRTVPIAEETQIGVWLRGGGGLVLRSVNVRTTGGGAGTAAGIVPGGPGVVACNRLNDCETAMAGVPGVPGRPGNAAVASGFAAAGFVAAHGGNGANGAPGHHGARGALGTTRSGCQECQGIACGCAGQPACGSDPRSCRSTSVTSGAGFCGCAGGGGFGGPGGRSGGASVAVYVSGASNVLVEDSLLVAGRGGAGAAGGMGGAGSPGQPGAAGAPATCNTTCVSNTSCNCVVGTPTMVAGGTAGTAGGMGGMGGAGGPGGGGPSFAVVSAETAMVNLVRSMLSSLGGGAAGGAMAPAGASGESTTF